MDPIRQFERRLIAVEGTLCVVLVLLMLALAGYNVLYRNLLVPLQSHWAHSGPPVSVALPPPTSGPGSVDAPPSKAGEAKKKPAVGGFGGAFGAGAGGTGGGDADPDEDGEARKADDGGDPPDEVEGFGGAFGAGAKDEDEDEDEDEAAPDGDDEDDGFGGAFGKPPAKSKDDDADDGDEGDEFFVEDEFANLPEISAAADDPSDDADAGPRGGPPPEGSFAARGIAFIDAIKLDWIDALLRQLVIIVSFLGACIATRRNKHINIDALSKLLKANGRRIVATLTNMLAVAVCLVLATGGSRLVRIGREHPRELVPFADEWTFQLMFPIGFGLLAFHFGIRLLEAAKGTEPVDPAEIAAGDRAPAPEPEAEDEPEPEDEPEDAPEDGEEEESR